MGPGMNPEEMERLFDDPNFVSQMNEMMNNPMFMEMMEQSPMMRGNPQLRQMLRNPEFRRMMFTPENMRRNLQLSRAMTGGGAFPAPGVTDNNTAAAAAAAADGTPAANPPTLPAMPNSPLDFLTQRAPPSDDQHLLNMLQMLRQHAQPGDAAAAAAGGDAANRAPEDAALPPPGYMANLLRDMFPGLEGGGGGGLGGLGGFGGLAGAAAAAAPPADTRPPEERYESQLRQLNDMGFVEFERNIEALRRSGGSLQGAIEYLLSHP
jgi:ubiquilin